MSVRLFTLNFFYFTFNLLLFFSKFFFIFLSFFFALLVIFLLCRLIQEISTRLLVYYWCIHYNLRFLFVAYSIQIHTPLKVLFPIFTLPLFLWKKGITNLCITEFSRHFNFTFSLENHDCSRLKYFLRLVAILYFPENRFFFLRLLFLSY